jgi:hypothetical protein
MLSHSVNKIKLIAFRGESMVKYACSLTHLKAERRTAGNCTALLIVTEVHPMTTNLFLPHCLTYCRICESPQPKLSGTVCVGGAS